MRLVKQAFGMASRIIFDNRSDWRRVIKSCAGRLTSILLGAILAGTIATRAAAASDSTLQAGLAALRAKDFQHACQIFSRLAKEHPSSANLAYLGTAELFAGNTREAIPNLRRSLALGNKSAGVHYYLGLAYLSLHADSAAITELRAALEKDPTFSAAKSALGVALLNSDKPRTALPYLEATRAHLPRDPDVWANLIRARFDSGQTRAAMVEIDEATQAIPDNPRLAATLAFLCLHHHEAQKARQLLENANALAPQDNNLKILLAHASIKSNEATEALAVLKGVPDHAGSPGELAYLRGSAYMLSGDTAKSGGLLTRAVAADPGNPEYLLSYAALQAFELHYAGALATLRKVRQLERQSSQISYQIAVTYALIHQYQQAQQACKESLRLTTQPAETYFLMGIIELEQGEYPAAVKVLRQAVAQNSDTGWYHAGLGVALFQSGNLQESQKELDYALRLSPSIASTYLWRAQLFERLGKGRKAIADLKAYTVLGPSPARAYQQLAKLYAAEGELKEAAAARSRYEELTSRNNESGSQPSFLDLLLVERIRENLRQPG
jgi:predicted Zn-dependent protease